MIYRRLTKKDSAAYWALRLESVEREPRSFGPTPEEHRQVTIDQIAAMLNGPRTIITGAFDGTALVGFARFEREPYLKESHKGHVRGVYVSASHRGRGVAKALIGELIADVKRDQSVEQLMLAVGLFNVAARKAYIALGFVPFGIEPGGLKVGNDYVDEEHMIELLRDRAKAV